MAYRFVIARKLRTVKNKTADITDDVAARQAKIIDRAADFWERLKLNLRSLKFLPPLAWQRQLIGFTLMAIALVLPLKLLGYFNVLQDARGRILGESEQAVNNLRAALQGILPEIHSGKHLVVLPNRRALEVSVADLEEELKFLNIGSLKIYCKLKIDN